MFHLSRALLVAVAATTIFGVACNSKPKEHQPETTSAVDTAKSVQEAKQPVAKPAQEAKPLDPRLLEPDKATETAPESFKVKFETTQGDVVIDVTRAWAPIGADRFYNLVKLGYFTDIAFFRVVDGFMAQFGIHGNPKVNTAWRSAHIQDDPVKESNKRGYITFATSGPNSRTVQMFINFGDNSRLDSQGFSPFGKVSSGMEAVDKLYKGYGEGQPMGRGPAQARVQMQGNDYLKSDFPKLDYIKSASILP